VTLYRCSDTQRSALAHGSATAYAAPPAVSSSSTFPGVLIARQWRPLSPVASSPSPNSQQWRASAKRTPE
jgi:hypothetical protein